MNIADLQFLTPGSVFTREDGRESRFLHLTNTALPRKLQAEFPQQVVYADENGNILSCDVARFLKKRKFFNVDPDLEARLDNLLAEGTSSSARADALDLDDEDELTVVDGDSVFGSLPDTEEEESEDDGLPSEAATVHQTDDIDEPLDTVKYLLVKPNEDLPAFLTASQLQAATASYQQGPGRTDDAVLHTLFIRADEGINRKTLYASFSPKNVDHNATYDFQIEIEGREIVVNWDTFIGIFPCVYYGTNMYQIVFESKMVGAETPVSYPDTEADVAAAIAAVSASAPAVTVEDAEAAAELAEIEASSPAPSVIVTSANANPAQVAAVTPAPLGAQVQVQVKPQ